MPDLTDPNKEPYMIVLSKKESQKWVDAIAKRYAPVPFDQAVLCSLTLDAFYQKGVLAQGESLEGGESVEKLVALQQNFAVEKWLMGEIYAYTPDELEKLSTWIRGFKDC